MAALNMTHHRLPSLFAVLFVAGALAAPAHAAEAAADPVTLAQQLLTKLGFNIGEPDGKMGLRTANAIRLFQLQSGMPVTGEITPELLDQMKRSAG